LPATAGRNLARLDAMSEVLGSVRLTGATFFSAEFRAPWGFTSPPLDLVSIVEPNAGDVVAAPCRATSNRASTLATRFAGQVVGDVAQLDRRQGVHDDVADALFTSPRL
jgi:hypothetical protein